MDISNIINYILPTNTYLNNNTNNNINNNSVANTDDFISTNLLSNFLTSGISSSSSSSNSSSSYGSSFSVILQAVFSSMSTTNSNTLNSNLQGINLDSLDIYKNINNSLNNYNKLNDSTNLSHSNVASSINNYYSSKVSTAYNSYNKSSVEKIIIKQAEIKNAITKACAKYDMDPKLIIAVMKQESDFSPSSLSSAGAMGLMQLMPDNCVEYGVKNPYDINENIDAGVHHLKDMIKSQNNNVILGLAAYNAGGGTLRNRNVKTVNDIYKLPAETKDYITKVTNYYKSLNL